MLTGLTPFSFITSTCIVTNFMRDRTSKTKQVKHCESFRRNNVHELLMTLIQTAHLHYPQAITERRQASETNRITKTSQQGRSHQKRSFGHGQPSRKAMHAHVDKFNVVISKWFGEVPKTVTPCPELRVSLVLGSTPPPPPPPRYQHPAPSREGVWKEGAGRGAGRSVVVDAWSVSTLH